MKPSSWRISSVCGVPRSQNALKPHGLVPVARSMLATLRLYDSRSCSGVMEYCAAHVCPWPEASCPRCTISLARAGWRSTVAPTMWEVTLTFRRSNMSNSRGSPSLNPYSYHLAAGRSGYIGSSFGIGLSAPRLSASFHLHRYGDDQTGSVRPERGFRLRLRERDRGPFAAESLRFESVRCRTNRECGNGTIVDEVTTFH